MAALGGQGISIIISFIARIIFIRQLGEVYLGINSLFTNIVGLLSLAELGVGTAINYSLYRPLASGDIEKIKSLMDLYRRVYYVIGCIIILIGIFLLPFLDFFVSEADSAEVSHLYLIFILFVINSAVSYFYSFKRALIIADQHRYIATIYRYIFYVFMNILQIIILLTTKDFIFYLFAMLACTILENIFVSKKADKLYPYLKDKNIVALEKKDIDEIKKNTLALLCHKIGGSVVNSTDNILISKIVGIISVGKYSNYLLITNALNIVIAQIFNALVASIGNLGVTEKSEKAIKILNELFFINFCTASIISASIFATANILIETWFGKDMTLDRAVLWCITINFFFYEIRKTVLAFRDAYGLYWYDRYKPLAEAAINLIVSIILGIKIGMIGIFIGTIASSLSTCLWVEPYVLYKYGFHEKATRYYISLIKYTLTSLFLCFSCDLLISRISLSGLIGFISGVFICIVLSGTVIVLLFCKTTEFKSVCALIKRCSKIIFKKRRNLYD